MKIHAVLAFYCFNVGVVCSVTSWYIYYMQVCASTFVCSCHCRLHCLASKLVMCINVPILGVHCLVISDLFIFCRPESTTEEIQVSHLPRIVCLTENVYSYRHMMLPLSLLLKPQSCSSLVCLIWYLQLPFNPTQSLLPCLASLHSLCLMLH